MPKLDGAALFRQMQMRPDTKALPVVFITAKAAQRDLDELTKMGAVATISKPFSPKDLPEQLREIWKNCPSRAKRARRAVRPISKAPASPTNDDRRSSSSRRASDRRSCSVPGCSVSARP